MINIKNTVTRTFFKIDILSNTPGRLRIKVVHFKKIPKDSNIFIREALEHARKVRGVKEVSFNQMIGTAVIHYDPSVIKSDEIISKIDDLREIIIENIKEITEVGEKDNALAISKVNALFERGGIYE